MRIGSLILGGLIGLLALTVVTGSWYTVNERERGVLLRNGRLVAIVNPGLGFKLPLIDSVMDVSIETHIDRPEPFETYSRDQQPADVVMSVNYRIPADPKTIETMVPGGAVPMLSLPASGQEQTALKALEK